MDEASKEKDTKYEEVVFAVNKTICENLKSLLEARHLSQRQFCKQLAEQRTSITRSYFSKILADPKYISAAFLLSCCDFFGISLKNLVSTDFDASEYIYNNTEDHKDYLNIKALLQKKRSSPT
ncbi:MAG: helix-turn-helix transcriptional regulator [Lachnospiraceae bacterium]|jgi:transcriptional regulator with XRE-family HTH domain|nr:helix-turn-helix transcriptional regulator [Lachnospiraceae bacterium]MCI9203854.1 helix-turn-helix transcriptional regulator [Lachnospiraceae bacterium]